jgi:hypothetical protein
MGILSLISTQGRSKHDIRMVMEDTDYAIAEVRAMMVSLSPAI